MSLTDFLKQQPTEGSTIADELNQPTEMVEIGSPEDYQYEEPPTAKPEPETRQRPEHETWVNAKLSPEELKAKAELETLKIKGIMQAGMAIMINLAGLMPEPLSEAEKLIYDDYILAKAKAKKAGQSYYVEKDDPIFEIIGRRNKIAEYQNSVVITAEESKVLTKAIYVTLHGKNERGELGEMSIAGAVFAISMAKMAPMLAELGPKMFSYIQKGIAKVKQKG